MVNKHGRNKKRKAGRIGRTKLKQHKRPKIKDATVRKYWDDTKSPTANLESMGILPLPNLITPITGDELSGDAASNYQQNRDKLPRNDKAAEDIFHVPPPSDPKSKRKTLKREDQEYIAYCLEKHGDDYTAMFRDIKVVNRMQHTEDKLRKMASRFFQLDPDQRHVPVPENVRHLVTTQEDDDEDES